MRYRHHRRPRAARLDPALVDAIQLIPLPAFVVSGAGEIVSMNPYGHRWLEAAPDRASHLQSPGGPDPATFRVTRSRASHGAFDLAVLRRLDVTPAETHVPPPWGLTRREEEVARCVARGFTNQQIAAELGCSNATVERHMTNILRKADVENRAALIIAIIGG